jgi:hypothetical protein
MKPHEQLRQYRWPFCLGLLVVALVAMCLYPFTPANRVINVLGAQRLREGMSEGEVNDLVGVPPGDYTSGPGRFRNPPLLYVGGPAGPTAAAKTAVWNDDRAQIVAEYDANGKLVRAFGCSRSRDSLIDFFLARLSW